MEENSESSKRLARQLKICKQELQELRYQLYVVAVREGLRKEKESVKKRKPNPNKYIRWILIPFAFAGIKEVASWIIDLIPSP